MTTGANAKHRKAAPQVKLSPPKRRLACLPDYVPSSQTSTGTQQIKRSSNDHQNCGHSGKHNSKHISSAVLMFNKLMGGAHMQTLSMASGCKNGATSCILTSNNETSRTNNRTHRVCLLEPRPPCRRVKLPELLESHQRSPLKLQHREPVLSLNELHSVRVF